MTAAAAGVRLRVMGPDFETGLARLKATAEVSPDGR